MKTFIAATVLALGLTVTVPVTATVPMAATATVTVTDTVTDAVTVDAVPHAVTDTDAVTVPPAASEVTDADNGTRILYPALLPPCDEEDGTVTSGGIAVPSCYWDAATRSNGKGYSFVAVRE